MSDPIDELKRTTCACDIDCLIAKDAILALDSRLDEAEKRITELELASPCPMLKSICEDWEYDAKPSPEDGNGSDQILLRHDNEEIGVIATIDELREIVRRWDAGV